MTADGHRSGRSAGADVADGAVIVRAPGSKRQSTATALAWLRWPSAHLVNRPSDAAGERPDADAILLPP